MSRCPPRDVQVVRLGGRHAVAMACDRRRSPLARLAGTGRRGGIGGVSPACTFSHTLHPPPVDDLDILDVVDRVEAHQPAHRQLLDHRADRLVAEFLARKHLQPDGAGPQRLDAEIVGEVPQAEKEQTGHRRAVDDGLPGPEVGRELAITGHRVGSRLKRWRRCNPERRSPPISAASSAQCEHPMPMAQAFRPPQRRIHRLWILSRHAIGALRGRGSRIPAQRMVSGPLDPH